MNLILRILFVGALVTAPFVTSAADPKFRRPLNTVLSPVYSAYYDQDTTTNSKNYTCGATTVYNGHKGTDFRATVGTPIYAAAMGGLYRRNDTCSTYGYRGSTCGYGFGNYAMIDHEGSFIDGVGWRTVYAHMQQGTAAGYMTLYCGTQIGKTGSSGSSDGPHLHFEVQKNGYPNDDPFSGPCSRATSYWVNQNGGVPTTQCQ